MNAPPDNVVPFPSPAANDAPPEHESPPESRANLGALFLTALLVGGAILWVRGKAATRRADEELRFAMAEEERAQWELDAAREDLTIAHDWGTAHPLSVRYGE